MKASFSDFDTHLSKVVSVARHSKTPIEFQYYKAHSRTYNPNNNDVSLFLSDALEALDFLTYYPDAINMQDTQMTLFKDTIAEVLDLISEYDHLNRSGEELSLVGILPTRISEPTGREAAIEMITRIKSQLDVLERKGEA